MATDADELKASKVQQLLQDEWHKLDDQQRAVLESALDRLSLPPDIGREQQRRRQFGEKASDLLASFGGSWTFVLLFLSGLVAWTVLNTEILGPRREAFDPYPYVFLNLILSMLAAIQAPIIMMSQNRQAARDRIDAEIDHQVNVRAELQIRSLDGRLDRIEQQLTKLMAQ